MPIGPCAERNRSPALRRRRRRDPPRLGGDRRPGSRRRDQRGRLRHRRRLRRPRLPDEGTARRAGAGRLDRHRRRRPRLGGRRDLVDALHRRQPERPLSLPRRPGLSRLLSPRRARPLPAGEGADPRTRPPALDGRADRGAGNRSAGGGAAGRVRRRPHQRHRDRSRDHPRLPLRRRGHGLPGRRRDRPDPVAPRQDLDAAPRRPHGDGGGRCRLHPADLRSGGPGRRLGRTDLPVRGGPDRSRGLAARR